MPAEKPQENFDRMLERTLKASSPPVPTGFTEETLRQITDAEQQRILARMVLQKKLALAACIVLALLALGGAVVFTSITGGPTGQLATFIEEIGPGVTKISTGPHFFMLFAAIFGFAAYILVDLLVGDT